MTDSNYLSPTRRLPNQSNSPDERANNSVTSGIMQNQSHNRSRSTQDLVSFYKDTTFGTSKRMHIP